MLELGAYQAEGHRKVGRRAAEVVQKLVTVGELGTQIGREAIAVGMPEGDVYFAQDNGEAVRVLSDLVGPGDIVLVKGSRGMHMEEIVAALGER
ncbi:MAG TPA: hypothetical protein ENO24_07360 [Chloroflexi bacterium]|nr:hypothetical protein [Chloroflexota bacterium]